MENLETRILLATAGLRLGKSRNQVERLVMIGTLRGGRESTGRWWVDMASLEQYLAGEQTKRHAAA